LVGLPLATLKGNAPPVLWGMGTPGDIVAMPRHIAIRSPVIRSLPAQYRFAWQRPNPKYLWVKETNQTTQLFYRFSFVNKLINNL
jgi:hypothetical protein